MARALSRNGQQRVLGFARIKARGSAALASLGLMLAALAVTGCTKVLGDFKLADKPRPIVDAGLEAGSNDIIVTPHEGLQTTEWESRARFTIVLNTPPQANVAIALSTTPDGEGSASPESVTFTPANWNAPQTVFVTGQDDSLHDGNTIYTVVTSPASSDDPHYANMDPPDVTVLNIDDETPGFIITPLTALTTTESGGQATLTVALTAAPTTGVTVDLSSTRPGEGKVNPSTLAFTAANYRSPQTVTITGVDDNDIDGPRNYQIVTSPAKSSNDPAYDNLNPPDIDVVNIDDESAGVTITSVTGLTTNENAQTATFTVGLDGPPTGDVSITLTSNNPKEGTVSPAKLTFTSANWNALQTVTVTGVDDDVRDGNQPYKIVTGPADSVDGRYKGVDPVDIDLTNVDNDSAGLIVTAEDQLFTSEDGLAANFSVALVAKPNGDVTLDFTSTAPAEGSLYPKRITFTRLNWNAPRVIAVSGLDDGAAVDGDVAYYVRGSVDVATSDPDYGALPPVELDLVNLDNDTPGIGISRGGGLTTTEGGGKAVFGVTLRSKPVSPVRIDLATSNTGEGSVFPTSLTFTAQNFGAPQTVTVTGVDDTARDGPKRYKIITLPAISDDDNYRNLDGPDVDVVNLDDDTPNVMVLQSGDLMTTESGGTATFAVRLSTAPKQDVAINVSSTNTAEGKVTPGTLTFTAANWSSPQTVTVVGNDDAIIDGTQVYHVVIAPAVSGDGDYQGVDAEDVAVKNLDDETAAVFIAADTPLTTTEAGAVATFTVALGSPPQKPVTILLSSSRPGEGFVNPATMVFTSSNWISPQLVSVTGVDDLVADGNRPYDIIFARTSSTDPGYNGIKVPDVAVKNLDDETPGVNVVAAHGLTTTESGGTAQFSVVLNAQPASSVTIPLRSTLPSEGTVSTMNLVFTTANWKAPQTVNVTGIDDTIIDGARPYRIILDPPTGDPAYAAIDPSDVKLVNLDNDAPAIQVIAPKIATTTESGGIATFGVYLLSRPSDLVTIPLSSGNPGEGTLLRTPLKFSAANWATPQWVTVTGADDMVLDGDRPYKISVGPASNANSGYQGKRGSDVLLVNLDNDTAGLFVTPPQGPTTEGGIATNFTVALTTQPTSAVTVPIGTTRASEGMPLATSLVFTPTNWNAPQMVTVRGIDDKVIDGDPIYRVTVGPTDSGDAADPAGDPSYKGKKAPDVVIKNLDDDGAAIRVTAAPFLRTSEAGGTAKFAVVLASAPSDPVSVPLVSRDVGEGTISDPASGTLVFTTANWSVAQTVTVTGADDTEADGNAPYAIGFQPATSPDNRYAGRMADDVMLTNVDDDSPGLTVTAAPNLTTSEAGGTATFRMVLNMAPTKGVSFAVHSSNPGEGTVSPASVQFSADNWNVPQIVTITGQQDTVPDGNQVYSVIIDAPQSTDLGYGEIAGDQLSVTNIDDDVPAALAKQQKPSARREPPSSAHPPR